MNVARVISPSAVIASVLPVYILLVAGALLRWMGLIQKEHDVGIMRIFFTVMFPCFILDKVLGSQSLHSGTMVIWAILLGFGLIMVGISTGLLVGRLMGLEKGTGMRTFALSAGCQNFGFTAAPVVEILWGAGSLAMLFVHNIGVEIAMWSVGVMMMSGNRGIEWRHLLNGPIIAVTLGLTLVALGLDQHVTGPGRQAMSMIGVGAFPVAVFITGCSIMDLVGVEKPNWRWIVGGAVVRLVLGPVAILCCAKYLPLSIELRQVLVVQAAMPAGMTALLLARIYGGRPAVAVQIIVSTTLISLITLPWIITWGCAWIGLKPILP